MCERLGVSASGYYAWCKRLPSTRAKKDEQLKVRIKASFDESRKTYGSPRVLEDLREDGEKIGRNRVIRLMQAEGLRARVRKRFKNTTNSEHDQPIAPNVLERNFEAEAPNQRWVGDTTEMLTSSGGKFYLAAIIDLFSRFCVGWAVIAVNDRHLTMRVLEAAIRRRCPSAGLLHHSDRVRCLGISRSCFLYAALNGTCGIPSLDDVTEQCRQTTRRELFAGYLTWCRRSRCRASSRRTRAVGLEPSGTSPSLTCRASHQPRSRSNACASPRKIASNPGRRAPKGENGEKTRGRLAIRARRRRFQAVLLHLVGGPVARCREHRW